MRDPTLRDKGIKDLNFDKILYYEHENPKPTSFDKSRIRFRKKENKNKDLEEVQTTVKKVPHTERPQTTMLEEKPRRINLEFDDDIQGIKRAELLKRYRQMNRSVNSRHP